MGRNLIKLIRMCLPVFFFFFALTFPSFPDPDLRALVPSRCCAPRTEIIQWQARWFSWSVGCCCLSPETEKLRRGDASDHKWITARLFLHWTGRRVVVVFVWWLWWWWLMDRGMGLGVVDSLTLDDVALSDDDVHPFLFSSYNASKAHKKHEWKET